MARAPGRLVVAALGVLGAARSARAAEATAASSGEPLARERDLASWLARAPGGAPGGPATVGPTFFGLSAGELRLELDGFDLADPFDGRAPLELPLALFGRVATGGGETGALGRVVVESPVAGTSARRVARAGAAGIAPPRGAPDVIAQGTAMLDVGAFERFAGGRLSASLLVAPRFGGRSLDPFAGFGRGVRVRDVWPSLVRLDAELGAWRARLTALSSYVRERVERGERIAPLSAEHDRTALQAFAGVELARALGSRVTLSVAPFVLHGRSRLASALAEEARRSGTRGGVELRGSFRPTWMGEHLAFMRAGLELATGRRRGHVGPELRPGESAGPADAESYRAWIAGGETWRPRPWLELGGGLEIVDAGFVRSGSAPSRVARDVVVPTRTAVLPHAHVAVDVVPAGLRLFGAWRRQAAPLPLAAVAGTAESPSTTIALPVREVVTVGARAATPWASLAARALEVRDRSVVEDFYSQDNARLVLGNPPGATRRLRAVVVEGTLGSATTLVSASAVLGRLSGTYQGAADPASGRDVLGSTPQLDAPALLLHRDGRLPADRRFGVRFAVERRVSVGAYTIGGALAAWVQDGTPQGAYGRHALAGPGQVALLPRGAEGRTELAGALDAALTLSRSFRSLMVSVGLEVFNLTNHRNVVARDQEYTQAQAVARPGATSATLPETTGPSGVAVPPNPVYLGPTAWAEPFLARLVLSLEL